MKSRTSIIKTFLPGTQHLAEPIVAALDKRQVVPPLGMMTARYVREELEDKEQRRVILDVAGAIQNSTSLSGEASINAAQLAIIAYENAVAICK